MNPEMAEAPATPDPALADLLAERAIARQLILFARAMDARDWAALDAIVAEEATGDYGEGPLAGRAAIVATMRKYLDGCGPTQHLLGNLVIDLDGDRATSRCYVNDIHLGPGDKSALTFRTLGDYHDRWERRDGRWWMVERIKHNRAHVGTFEVFGLG